MRYLPLFILLVIFSNCDNSTLAPTNIEKSIVPQLVLESPSLINESDKKYLDKVFSRFISRRRFNGSILIAKGDEIVFDTVVGFANIRRRIPLQDTSAIQLASISKPITAAVMLSLVQEGKLKLSDTVTKYLKALPEEYERITIRMLLSHQSGLTQYYYYCDHLMDDKHCILSNDSLISIINCHHPGFAGTPGRKFSYCNTNYALLASVAESIEKKDFKDIVREKVIVPSGMKNSFLLDLDTDTFPKNLVYGNSKSNKIIDFDYLDGVVGDKGFFSTAKDLLLFDRYFFSCLMINEDLLEEACEPQVKISRNGSSYGLGWRIRFNEKLGKVIYHPGWWRGNRHLYFKVPSKDYTVIMLSNSVRGSKYGLNDLVELFENVQ